MRRIYPLVLHNAYLESANDLFKFCAEGAIEKVKALLNQNDNIYQRVGDRCNFVPLLVALTRKHEQLANLLLDIYERDLEALKATDFKLALIALRDDQTEEFLSVVENEPSDEVIPVLLKNSHDESPKCVYLRKILKDKNDPSITLSKKLESKNGSCDLNWRIFHNDPKDSFLHLAISSEMKTVVKRLLNHPTVNTKVLNASNHTPLHYAIFYGNWDIITMLLSKSDCESFHEDSSYLYQAALSGKQKSLDFVLNKMKSKGRTMAEILKIIFSFEGYNGETHDDYLFHVMSKEGNFQNFLNSEQTCFDDQDFCVQNSKGDTILHLLVISSFHKMNIKISLITKLTKRFPKLLLIENNDGQLPLHLSALHDVKGQTLFCHLLKLTVNESGNPEIFYANIEVAVASLEKAIELNKMLTEEYLKNFEKLLMSHGTRLLHKMITSNKSFKSLKGILSSSFKINPNNFYKGSNGFLLMSTYKISEFHTKLSAQTIERIQLLNNHHQIEDVNARDKTGTTFFMYIVGFCKDNEFINSLIAAGADCKAKNFENSTCLHFAVLNVKNEEIVKRLMDHGADPSIVNDMKMFPIHYALNNGNLDAVKLLLPFLKNEQLSEKFGSLNETLIQFCARCYSEDIIQTVLDFYKSRNVAIDLNDTNDEGDNLAMIFSDKFNTHHLDLIFSSGIDDIDFNNKNKTGETFVHKFARCQQMTRCFRLFEKYPKLVSVVNEQMNLLNLDGVSPMDLLVELCQYQDSYEESFVNFFVQIVSLENLQRNFYKFFKSTILVPTLASKFPNIMNDLDPENYYAIIETASGVAQTFHCTLEHLSQYIMDAKSADSRNILHLVCEKNNKEIIDATLKVITDVQFNILAKTVDSFGKQPVDLLNDANKLIFKNCFV